MVNNTDTGIDEISTADEKSVGITPEQEEAFIANRAKIADLKVLSNEDMLRWVRDPKRQAEFSAEFPWDRYAATLHFYTPILGTSPADPKALVAWKGLAKERKGIQVFEIEGDEDDPNAVAKNITKIVQEEDVQMELSDDRQGHTAFWKDPQGQPSIMSYQFRGFMINAITVMKEDFVIAGRTKSRETGLPRNADPIRLLRNNAMYGPFSVPIARKVDGLFGRTVRGMTAQGPRISINVSEVVGEPWDATFIINVRNGCGITQSMLEHILEYGQVEGISQWRSGGWGRFTYDLTKLSKEQSY